MVSKKGFATWLLTVVYALPHACFREELWRYVEALGQMVNISWLLIGDFNQVLYLGEKIGGKPVSTCKAQRLGRVFDSCQLVDLGFQGLKYTWSNCRI